jgi:hypothetical protein
MSALTYPLRGVDAHGQSLKVGDVVRVIGLPDLSDSTAAVVRFSRPVFRHIVGTYRRIANFDEYGHAELRFTIRQGRSRGLHHVWIEPWLLAKRKRRTAPANTRLQPTKALRRAAKKVW